MTISPRPLLLKTLPLLASFAAGLIVTSFYYGTRDRLALLSPGPDFGWRVAALARVYDTIGQGHFRSCESKVERLHRLVCERSPSSRGELPHLVASILLDGKDCNEHLVRFIDSREPIPAFPIHSGFRYSHAGGPNVAGVDDEQGLILWMLSRINHETLIPPNTVWGLCSMDDEARREFLSILWKDEIEGEASANPSQALGS